MNYEADDLLDMVDEWKFKLYDKLKSMTPEEETAFWKRARDKARPLRRSRRLRSHDPAAEPPAQCVGRAIERRDRNRGVKGGKRAS